MNEIIGIAFRTRTSSSCPTCISSYPAEELYVEAGNGFLQDQLLFATSYPFRAMKQTVDDFLAPGWKDEYWKDLARQCERVLGLRLPAETRHAQSVPVRGASSVKPDALRPYNRVALRDCLQDLAATAAERDRTGGTAKHERDLFRQSGLLALTVPA